MTRVKVGGDLVDSLPSLISAGAALLGVGAGSWLSGRTQLRLQAERQERDARSARANACIELLAAYRAFRRHLLVKDGDVGLIPTPSGEELPQIERGAEYWQALDRAVASVEILCGEGPVSEAARRLGPAIRVLAVARGRAQNGYIPDIDVAAAKEAEQCFLREAHAIVGLTS